MCSFHYQFHNANTVGPSCATLLSCLEQACLDVVQDILSGSISYTYRYTHMQVEDLLEMTAHLKVFKLPFKTRGELALGFWGHINLHVAYNKLMFEGYFLRPVELVPGVLALNCVAVATTVSGLVCWIQQTSTSLCDSISTI